MQQRAVATSRISTGLQPDERLRIRLVFKKLFEVVFLEACRADATLQNMIKDWRKLVYFLLSGHTHIRKNVAEVKGFLPAELVVCI